MEGLPRQKPLKTPSTPEEARTEILGKIAKGAGKGAASPFNAKAKEPKLTLYTQALADLEAEGVIYTDRSGAKSKYFLAQYAPTLDEARKAVLDKLTAAGATGAASLITAAVKGPRRSFLVQALAELEAEGAIGVDRRKKAVKYFLKEFAPQLPSVAAVAAKLERLSALKHPALLTAPELKKSLAAPEKPFSGEAVQALESSRRLVRLSHGKAIVYAHGDSLRAILGAEVKEEPPPISPEAIRRAYAELVQRKGFIDVEIAALQRQAEVPLAELKDWLRAEHAQGRANFFTGDWSLSDEATRAGVIELRGERYLLVRLDK